MTLMVRLQQSVRWLLCVLLLLSFAPGAANGQEAAAGRGVVFLAAIEGPIGPASMRHVEEAIETAEERGAAALVLRLNTPGGLADSMREIISEILGSTVPIIGWVAPPGAHAASAGTFVIYATHLAAMAPGTNLGAATPVQIGGMPGTPGGADPENEADDQPSAAPANGDEEKAGGGPARPADPLSAKATNDAVAFIRSLAAMRGRDAEWAEAAVREAASLPAREALERNVIELIAGDVDELLTEADGRTVTVGGEERTLATLGAPIERLEPDAVTRLLSVLSNPNIALVLMMIGIYGIIFEFWNPGGIGPGIIGAISLVLGLYALNQLPLDYAGLALILLGVAFMVAEAFTPTYGVLGIGGLAAFVMGSAMLIDTDVPAYQLSPWLIGAMAAVSGIFLILLLGFTFRAYRHAPAGTAAGPIGAEARVLEWSDGEGQVWAAGERWTARGPRGLAPGDPVRVDQLDGLTLIVERLRRDETRPD